MGKRSRKTACSITFSSPIPNYYLSEFNEDGAYQFGNLAAGNYVLRAEREFRDSSVSNTGFERQAGRKK
jgi:hypothetical protein